MRFINGLITLLILTNLLYILEKLTMPPILIEVTRKAKMIKNDILLKGLAIISTERVTAMVLYLLKVLKPLTRKLTMLSTICEEAKAWTKAGVLITGILVVEKMLSIMRIIMTGLITKK